MSAAPYWMVERYDADRSQPLWLRWDLGPTYRVAPFWTPNASDAMHYRSREAAQIDADNVDQRDDNESVVTEHMDIRRASEDTPDELIVEEAFASLERSFSKAAHDDWKRDRLVILRAALRTPDRAPEGDGALADLLTEYGKAAFEEGFAFATPGSDSETCTVNAGNALRKLRAALQRTSAVRGDEGRDAVVGDDLMIEALTDAIMSELGPPQTTMMGSMWEVVSVSREAHVGGIRGWARSFAERLTAIARKGGEPAAFAHRAGFITGYMHAAGDYANKADYETAVEAFEDASKDPGFAFDPTPVPEERAVERGLEERRIGGWATQSGDTFDFWTEKEKMFVSLGTTAKRATLVIHDGAALRSGPAASEEPR